MREEFEVGEQHLDHAGAVDEIGNVGLGDGAPDCLEPPADRQILEVETEPHRLHTVLLEQVIQASSPRKRGSRGPTPECAILDSRFRGNDEDQPNFPEGANSVARRTAASARELWAEARFG
jgi:hypothetical protein